MPVMQLAQKFAKFPQAMSLVPGRQVPLSREQQPAQLDSPQLPGGRQARAGPQTPPSPQSLPDRQD